MDRRIELFQTPKSKMKNNNNSLYDFNDFKQNHTK